jgi:hypothetical protein
MTHSTMQESIPRDLDKGQQIWKFHPVQEATQVAKSAGKGRRLNNGKRQAHTEEIVQTAEGEQHVKLPRSFSV